MLGSFVNETVFIKLMKYKVDFFILLRSEENNLCTLGIWRALMPRMEPDPMASHSRYSAQKN